MRIRRRALRRTPRPIEARQRGHTALAATSVGAVLAGALATPADAAERSLAALHLARGQAAQLNVSLVDPPDPVMSQACEATLAFVDGRGAPLLDRSGAPILQRATLNPGETRTLRLPASAAFSNPDQLRALFRARVTLQDPPEPVMPNPCASVAVSVEVFDTLTGQTTIVLQDPPEPITPQVDPPEPIMPQ